MSLLGNILWLMCGGLIAGAGHILGSLVICLNVIGIPFGYQEIKLSIETCRQQDRDAFVTTALDRRFEHRRIPSLLSGV